MDRLEQLAGRELVDRGEHLLLATEVLVERAPRDASGAEQVLDARGREAEAREDADGGADDEALGEMGGDVEVKVGAGHRGKFVS